MKYEFDIELTDKEYSFLRKQAEHEKLSDMNYLKSLLLEKMKGK